jgi:hypothetical protein
VQFMLLEVSPCVEYRRTVYVYRYRVSRIEGRFETLDFPLGLGECSKFLRALSRPPASRNGLRQRNGPP